jgi:hypothetical protein
MTTYYNIRSGFFLSVFFAVLLWTIEMFVFVSYYQSFNNIMQMVDCDSQNVDVMFLELMRRNVSVDSSQVDEAIQKYLTLRNYSVDTSEIVTVINKTAYEGEILNVSIHVYLNYIFTLP